MTESPPAYDDVIQIEMERLGQVSVPDLPDRTLPSLDEVFYTLPETIVFNRMGDDDKNTFYVRDTRNCILIKVIWNPVTADLYNANGDKFLTIQTTRVTDGEDEYSCVNYTRKCTVFHDQLRLGTIECSESDRNQISVSNLYDKYDFGVNCMGAKNTNTDIVLSKSRTSPPVCRANIKPRLFTGFSPVINATLVFPTDTTVTKVEQCLCIATVISFILTQESVDKTPTFEQLLLYYFFAVVGCIAGIIFIVVCIKIMA